MSQAILFPGQGAQQRGMGRCLFDRFPSMCKEAEEILGYDIKALCLEDPDKRLNLTQYTQPALFTVNAMSWKAAKADGLEPPVFMAGHSLGEYNALAAAGSFDFSTGLRLVKKRGELMARAENGGMAAVIGPDPVRVRNSLSAANIRGVHLANLNTPSQTVVSGSRQGIEAAAPLFRAMEKTRYIVLNVSGAFHSPFMEDAAREFKAYMDKFEFCSPDIPVVSNVLARPYPLDHVGELLCEQMTAPVRWMDSIRYMAENGVKGFRETGPGRVLTHMVSPILGASAP